MDERIAEKVKASLGGVTLEHFYAYTPTHQYIFAPTGTLWCASGVNAELPPVLIGKDDKGKDRFLPANIWLDKNRSVQQMTWTPGEPQIIEDRLMKEGGWLPEKGFRVFNKYRPPPRPTSADADPAPWVNHIKRLYPDDYQHIICWCAARVQRPHDKINHALVLVSNGQGIGKDTILAPVLRAIGEWNCEETSPNHLLDSTFTGYAESVLLRISEAHDMGDFNKFQLYDRLKTLTAAPPEVFRINRKYLPEYYVPNVVGVVITSNHLDAFYLPPDDRRTYVAHSDLKPEDFGADYFNLLYRWFETEGGNAAVHAYLAALDLSNFDVKRPPQKTSAFHQIVALSSNPEDSELADVIDELKNPSALTLDMIKRQATPEFALWLNDRKNRKAISHRIHKVGYVIIKNDCAKDGLWKFQGKRQMIYAKSALPLSEQVEAARILQERHAPIKTPTPINDYFRRRKVAVC